MSRLPRPHLGAPRLALALALAVATSACPDLPNLDPEAPVFVPLTLDRVFSAAGPPEGNTRVAIFGAGFLHGTSDSRQGADVSVHFSDRPGTTPLIVSDTQLNVTVPAGSPGLLVDVTVRLADGQTQTLREAYLYRSSLGLNALAPSTGPIAGGIEITLSGQGFTSSTRALVGGRLLDDLRLIDATTLRGRLPARLDRDAPLVDVAVSDGREQRVLEDAFTYLRPLALRRAAPAAGPSSGGTEVSLEGSGFTTETIIRVNTVPAEIVARSGDNRLTIRMPPGPPGPVDLHAEDPATAPSARPITLPAAFYRRPPSPPSPGFRALHLTPAAGPLAGTRRVAVVVDGLDATASLSAKIGSTPVSILASDASQGIVTLDIPPATTPGPAALTLTQGAASTAPLTFTYAARPTLTALAPATGSTAGLQATLSGTHLTPSATLTLGGRPVTVRGGTATRLDLTLPAGVSGPVDLVYDDGAASYLLPAAFEYIASSVHLWQVSKPYASRSGGGLIHFFGEGFRTTPPEPRFGTTLGTDLTVLDDHEALARAPRGDEGWVSVGGGPAGRLAMALAYKDPHQPNGGPSGGPIREALNVTVQDYYTRDGVPGAFVMLWDDIDGPYLGLTDDRGQITFSDLYFAAPQAVTASADAYTSASIVDFDARDVTLTLIPFVPPSSGNGNPNPPTPPPDAVLGGLVRGFDKYAMTLPGDCDTRLAGGVTQGTACEPCTSDRDCAATPNMTCTPIHDQGPRCTAACTPSGDCAPGYSCVLTETSGRQCLPSPGERALTCGRTVANIFAAQPDLVRAGPDDRYELTVRPGEYGVVCLGGVRDVLTGALTPLVMGVLRHVFAVAGTRALDHDIILDTPLPQTLRLRLDGAPTGRDDTRRHSAQVFLDLGSDGVFPMPQRASALDRNLFTLRGFPVSFRDALYDASLTIYATALADVAPEAQTGEGSFVHLQDLRAPGHDALFALAESRLGAPPRPAHRARDIGQPVTALTAVPGSPARLWAVGPAGRALAFDGALWGAWQAPTRATLRGLWASSATAVWAVGDAGTLLHFDGLAWSAIPGPPGLEAATWRGITGFGAPDAPPQLWIWGPSGVWTSTPETPWTLIPDLDGAEINSLIALDSNTLWAVGVDGFIQSFIDDRATTWTVPGPTLRALAMTTPTAGWAVGDQGRLLRWDGASWFDWAAPTRSDLHAITASRADRAWAVGDAGAVLRWDGVLWRPEATAPDVDLRAVTENADGHVVAGGLPTVIVGPFMMPADLDNPNNIGTLSSRTLSWHLDPGADASLTWLTLMQPQGFPFWQLMVRGPNTQVTLADLQAAWGLQALWPGTNNLQVVRIFSPDFDMNNWDETFISPYRWRSWSVVGRPITGPTARLDR